MSASPFFLGFADRLCTVDPGINGALILIDTATRAIVEAAGMPVVRITKAGKTKGGNARTGSLIDWAAVAHLIREWRPGALVVETQRPMAKDGRRQGVSSTFLLGRQFGGWEGLAAGLGVALHLIEAQRWRAANGLPGGKEASLAAVGRQAPQVAAEIASRIKDKERRIAAADCWCMAQAHLGKIETTPAQDAASIVKRRRGRPPRTPPALGNDEFFA
jgi:hypothetical protein